ncbi:phenylalanine--tRNA ligase subunit beta [Sulfuricurvum sp. RIFCSPLOWO2_12_FULL_43_24]|uniref:phenylalanine--tRNA ligase subunit beta n=1 Tax=Sulfuricurvum sp. RIFCSPLOWO2_12_FULL_43_24 TaxID=1802247 RepID=UPI0008C83AAF|nr:phenylalanine--tRNA ligase subunit beta [Sulfuricurvum sp. RIFCSPLOWO2_12_FULL_43_24]OHD89289.1 MAG: phenylalanine--tRNA ligase subunit beta [Sulfuricurvum sp. RIFCSPLOWO2_12_FULL_43_24]
MIVTKNWLNEWIDLDGINADTLCKTFNAIGLEVDRHEAIRVADGVVIGYVEKCEKHPDADKLNVCQVNVGNEVRQIVCGASNVREGIHIALATVGAELPGGLKIKEAVLRGVDSHGMICSSKEIGLPSMGEGIMILDPSIGELVLGKNLNEYGAFNDDVIEIELTANRGDCLSIHGIARDLRAALSRELREINYKEKQDGRLGIGRILQLQHTDTFHADLLFGAVDVKEFSVPFAIALRLAIIEEVYTTAVDALLLYTTQSTGVILRAYPFEKFGDLETKGIITFENDENGYAALYGKEKVSVIGVSQEKEAHFTANEGLAVIEASYIAPDIIAKKMGDKKIPSCPHYYRSSRGSEPKIEMGIRYAGSLFEKYSASQVYGGNIELTTSYEPPIISMGEEEFESFIGLKIDKTRITQIFKNLGMEIGKPNGSTFAISVPKFRHDIVNKQDIIEEVVRIVGIDNIPSKPFVFAEANQMSNDLNDYKKTRMYRHRAAQSGFYESVHFVFNERLQVEKYGFVCTDADKELLNPITATFDTLRPTLLVGLLNSASANVKVNQKKIALFEAGMVFDTNRQESKRLGFIVSGAMESEKIANAGKPAVIDFAAFTKLIADVVGSFELVSHTPSHSLAHPYVCAKVMINGVEAGEIFRLHPSIEEDHDLAQTFMCEIKTDALAYGLVEARAYSKYQASFRDLSILISKEVSYESIKEVIEKHRSSQVRRFYPVDRYVSETLGEQMSLTLRFVLQSEEKTLEDEDITMAMESILNGLKEELGVNLR